MLKEKERTRFYNKTFIDLKKKNKNVNLIICGSKNNNYSKKLKKNIFSNHTINDSIFL